MKMTSDLALKFLEMFNAVVTNYDTPVDHIALNEKAMKVGYIVKPEASKGIVAQFLKTKEINVNSTFYTTWEDVTSRTRFELFIDQICHYMSTYGTGFSCSNGFTMNDGVQDFEFNFTDYKVIEAISETEMMDRCYKMLCSGIALKSDTVATLCEYIYNVCYDNQVSVNIDDIKNREARILLYDKFHLAPHDKFELIKYIYYKATGNAMILKNDRNLKLIKNNPCFDFNILDEDQLKGLASIFFRYKDIILMFKNQNNSPIINKIRRMANKYHKPMKVGFWEDIVNNTNTSLNEIYARSAELTNYKLITLINMLEENSFVGVGDMKMYVVRNGKMFLKNLLHNIDNDRLLKIREMLYKRLVKNLATKNMVTEKVVEFDTNTGENVEREEKRFKVVKVPANLMLACPTSEKNFIGNVPFGSYISMGNKNNIIGIYWRNEWGTHDFDLSMNDIYGNRIGWDSDYYNSNNSLVYSGDMTNANPEATELLFAANNVPEGSVYVNRFNGKENSKFEFFYAVDVPNKRFGYSSNYGHCGHMCDPSNIKASAMLTSTDCQSMIGVVANNRFVFCDFSSGNNRVARANKTLQESINDVYKRKLSSMVYVNNILLEAGYKLTTDVNAECDIDLVDIKRDTLISLFDKE